MKKVQSLTYPIARVVTGLLVIALMLGLLADAGALGAMLARYGAPGEAGMVVAGIGIIGGAMIALGVRARGAAWAMVALDAGLIAAAAPSPAALAGPQMQVHIVLLAALLMIATHGAGGYALQLRRG